MEETKTDYALMKETEQNKRALLREDKCDKYDYLAAVACGAVGGLVDIFLVGTPGDSVLGKWTDSQVDNAVKGFAKLVGWNPSQAQTGNVASAIGFLERKYKVNYDQRHTADVGNAFNMSAKNHHMMSLSHSPDIVGLFFSILNQFTSTSSFIANGKIITIATDTYELQGGNFIAKLFCGVANWFGHIMSDIAGSSGARGNAGRGAGVVMPFYELFQFCKFGSFKVGNDRQDLATIATRAFQEGYDSIFGKNIITYDENRDPETYVFDKLNDGLFKVKSIYFDDLDFELEDYLFEVSEHYLCQSFSAMEFRERIKSANSPYHDWYNAIADDDNPVLVLGKVRN